MIFSIDEIIKRASDAGYHEGRLDGMNQPYGYTHEVLREAWRKGYELGEKDRKEAERKVKP